MGHGGEASDSVDCIVTNNNGTTTLANFNREFRHTALEPIYAFSVRQFRSTLRIRSYETPYRH
jgi:hypothetical protein